jgi:lauroyl/myristoyl acyltransferase
LGMQFVLAPAAFVLPRKLAVATAHAVSLLLLGLPEPGLRTYRKMRRAFGKGRLESMSLAWGWLTRPLSDFVVLKRLVYGRENPVEWKIVERNVENIKALRESGEPYIIAVGHFSKQPCLSAFSPNIIYGNAIQIASPQVKRIRSLYDLRIHIQYGAFLKAFSCLTRSCEFVYIKDLRTARTLYNRLRERGNVVFIPVDALWSKTSTGYYERAFAGHKSRVFSIGAAQVAQLTQCPIISCVHKMEGDGTMVLEWSKPIRLVDNDVDKAIEVMNELLDTMEVAVGERPTQYIFEIGGERSWNSQRKRWENIK